MSSPFEWRSTADNQSFIVTEVELQLRSSIRNYSFIYFRDKEYDFPSHRYKSTLSARL